MVPMAYRVGVVCFVAASLGMRTATAQSETDRLVTVKTGDLPIILTAPHGGSSAIPGVPERRGDGVKQFNSTADVGTDRLTMLTADALEKKMGKRPYLVVARFHRKFLDANRPRSDAYEADEAKLAYDAYHKAIDEARREVIRRWGYGVLLDVHGQGAESKAIFRGTQNGKTTTHLIGRFGREAVVGKQSLFGRLAEQGIPVIPAVDSTDREDRYVGGYTVVAYGSGSGGTLDAIQLELGRDLRASQHAAATADKLAHGIAAFSKSYLPQSERNPPPKKAE